MREPLTADAFLAGGGFGRRREFFESALEGLDKLFGCVFSLMPTGLASGGMGLKGKEFTPSKHNHFEGFDPGSERTLAAWIRHASRTGRKASGARVSKATVTNPMTGYSRGKPRVIPSDAAWRMKAFGL